MQTSLTEMWMASLSFLMAAGPGGAALECAAEQELASEYLSQRVPCSRLRSDDDFE